MNDIYIPGPIYDNHNVCPTSDYVCSFTNPYNDIQYDLYVASEGDGRQVVLWREDSEYPHSYGASTFESLVQSSKISNMSAMIITVLFEKGKFVWSKNSK